MSKVRVTMVRNRTIVGQQRPQLSLLFAMKFVESVALQEQQVIKSLQNKNLSPTLMASGLSLANADVFHGNGHVLFLRLPFYH